MLQITGTSESQEDLQEKALNISHKINSKAAEVELSEAIKAEHSNKASEASDFSESFLKWNGGDIESQVLVVIHFGKDAEYLLIVI